jgi:hypothetical protein
MERERRGTLSAQCSKLYGIRNVPSPRGEKDRMRGASLSLVRRPQSTLLRRKFSAPVQAQLPNLHASIRRRREVRRPPV